MIVVGLTGSIGMGKSTAANMLRRLGVPVHDSDAVVHRLMSAGGDAVAAAGNEFSGVVHNGIVDRAELGKRVFVDRTALRKLEEILHPLVQRDRQRFFARCRRLQNRVVVIDVPLLFETGGDRACDITLVVSAPASIQWTRVSNRPGMTRERFDAIVSRQMSDAEKRRLADFIVPTGLGFRVTLRSLARIVRLAKRRTTCRGNAFSRSTRWARS
jgi:dephospho-CoA kinase